MQKRTINPWQWQDQFGYAQAVEVTGAQQILYCAGQTAIDAQGNAVHPGDMGAQIRTALDNLEEVLAKAGYRLADVVRLNVYTVDIDQTFATYGELAGRLAKAGVQPAMTAIGVTRLAYPDLMVEIEATAVR